MPFTLSHPAIVIPLARRGLILSALVVGSMAPDFIYFLCLSTRCQFGHTLAGLFLFCLPAGWIMLWIFHHILKYPLIALFPTTHQEGLIVLAEDFRFLPWRRFLFITGSLLIGAITHIVWDSVTHRHGWVVRQLWVLNVPILEIGQESLKVYKVLQYGSTLLGALILLYWYLKWLTQAPRQAINSLNSLTLFSTSAKILIILGIGASACSLATLYGFLKFYEGHSFYHVLYHVTIITIDVIFMELIIFSAVWHNTRSHTLSFIQTKVGDSRTNEKVN